MSKRAVLGVVVSVLLFLGAVPLAFACRGINLISMSPVSANVGTGAGETVQTTVNYDLSNTTGCGYWYLKVGGVVVAELVSGSAVWVKPLVVGNYNVTVSNSTVALDSNALSLSLVSPSPPPPAAGVCDGLTGGDLAICGRVEAVRLALADQASSLNGVLGPFGYWVLGAIAAWAFIMAIGQRW